MDKNPRDTLGVAMIADHSARPLAELYSLNGRRAVVTGGAKGIGAASAARLAEAGAEVLVADLDGKAGPELYAAREAHTVKGADCAPVVKDPVRIVRFDKRGQTWSETTVATIDDRQCRFLVPADIDGDGKSELIAAAWKTGLYLLRAQADGSFAAERFEADSTGFEHATFATDLDQNGKVEVYVAADDQRSLRRYAWNGTAFDRTVVAPIPEGRITWNIQAYRP